MSFSRGRVRPVSTSSLRSVRQVSVELEPVDSEVDHSHECGRGRSLVTEALRLVRKPPSAASTPTLASLAGAADAMELWGFRVRSYVEHFEGLTFMTVVVQEVLPGTPAEEVGLCHSDQIISINSTSLKTLEESSQLVEMLTHQDEFTLELVVLPAKLTKLSNVQVFPPQSASLGVLWCVRNQLTTLTLWHVDLSNRSGLDEIDLTRLVLINTLAVCHCSLATLDKLKGLERLQFLRYLRLCNNRLTCDQLGADCVLTKISSIRTLMLNRNRLVEFPVCIFSLHQLEKLTLSYNMIKEIPLAISCLSELQMLCVDGNALVEVDPNVHSMSNLKFISVAKNRLEYYPYFEGQGKVSAFCVHGNPFTVQPISRSPALRRDSRARRRSRHGSSGSFRRVDQSRRHLLPSAYSCTSLQYRESVTASVMF